jgi:hypothetical protein
MLDISDTSVQSERPQPDDFKNSTKTNILRKYSQNASGKTRKILKLYVKVLHVAFLFGTHFICRRNFHDARDLFI